MGTTTASRYLPKIVLGAESLLRAGLKIPRTRTHWIRPLARISIAQELFKLICLDALLATEN